MPELPEVEVVRRRLEPRVVGRRVVALDVLDPAVSVSSEHVLRERLVGRWVIRAGRRGKWLLVELAGSPGGTTEMLAVVHLRMTGRLVFDRGVEDDGRRPRFEIGLHDGSRLFFFDVRRFGRLWAVPADDADDFFAGLGVEPLSAEFTPELLRDLLAGRRSPLKSFLLDQRHVAGVGNIYADEALFRARLHPLRPAGSVGPREARRLHSAVRTTLQLGIDHEGSSVESFVDPAGERGRFQEILNVYQRTGEPCRVCDTPVRRLVVAGRSTHYCPRCQPRRSMRMRTHRTRAPRRRPAGDDSSSGPAGGRGGMARLYVVAAFVPRRRRLPVGALGEIELARGWHAYVGSAERGREARVARHRRREKPLRWHADHLFAAHPARLAWTLDVPAGVGGGGCAGDLSALSAECRLADLLAAAGRRSTPPFGASDCGCPGHLVRFDSRQALAAAVVQAASCLRAEAVVG